MKDSPTKAANIKADQQQNSGLWTIRNVGLAVLVVFFIWAYSSTFAELVSAWWNIDDYSHGFLVIPIAAFFLYMRRETRPAIGNMLHWSGLILVCAAAALRWAGASYFIEAFDGWSMILWIAGLTWLLGGWPLVRWASPAIGFLFLMIPLPYRMETALSLPLQKIAARGSTWLLQSLGQPAIQEGTTIFIGEIQLEIVRACSGLRMFTGVIALAYVFAVLSKRPWWDKTIVLVSAIPAAIIANIIRITTTGLLYQVFESESMRETIHDYAGWFTILVAALLLGGLSAYMRRLVVEAKVVTSREIIGAATS